MSGTRKAARVVASPNVREFFRDSLDEALARQQVEAEDHTVHYVVNLLTLFTRSEELYGDAPAGRCMPPLVHMLADAVEAETERDRDRRLQRLGDVALFMAGFFPDFFARKPVDADYYIRMGGAAYGTLAERVRPSPGTDAFGDVFAELACKFAAFVDVIGEIADLGRRYTSRDILRLYELWLATGSRRARTRLAELGVRFSDSSALQH
jgi:hypothetical protein